MAQAQEGSVGLPRECDTDEQRQAGVYGGVTRAFVGTQCNQSCMWGAFGQRDNLVQVKTFYHPLPFQLIMDSDQHDIWYVSFLDENWVELHCRGKDECARNSMSTPIFLLQRSPPVGRVYGYLRPWNALANASSITTPTR